MTKLRVAVVVLPAFGVGLALPAWAADPPSEQKPNSATVAQSEQPRTDAPSKDADSPKGTESTTNPGTSSKGKKSHGPTAVMDRATPAEKSPAMQANSAKHPPTGRMDQATPDQRSPSASSSRQTSGNESESPAPK